MKVKCIRFIDNFGNETDSSSWLKINSIYHVLSISVDNNRGIFFGIIVSEPLGEWPNFGSYSANCFEVITTIVPSNWRVWIHESCTIGISPLAWQEPGFAEALIDHDLSAYSSFVREREIIMKEDP